MIKKKLRPYQVEAVERWKTRTHDCLGLFHEMRVGKTLPAIAIIDHQAPEQILVFTTKKGIAVWAKEIHESTDWDWKYEIPGNIKVLNFNVLQNKRTFRKLSQWARQAKTFMVVDEAHHIKRRGSVWSRRCRALGKKAKWRLALTGTPIAQGIHDAWAIYNYLDPSIFGPWQISERIVRLGRPPLIRVLGGFQPRYVLLDAKWRSKVVGYQNEEEFYEVFHRHCIRKTLAEVKRGAGEKPVRIRRLTLKAPLAPDEAEVYRSLEEDLEVMVNEKRVQAVRVITQAMKLQQICGGFLLDEDRKVHALGNTKLNLLHEAFERLPKRRGKVVVVCRFLHELDHIDGALYFFFGYKSKRIQGGVPFDPTQTIEEDVILMQIQSGEAIDLAIADTIIYYSRDYSHINSEQSKFRILQYNSERVTYIDLVIENSVDELILEATRTKKRFADVVCDHYRRHPDDRNEHRQTRE